MCVQSLPNNYYSTRQIFLITTSGESRKSTLLPLAIYLHAVSCPTFLTPITKYFWNVQTFRISFVDCWLSIKFYSTILLLLELSPLSLSKDGILQQLSSLAHGKFLWLLELSSLSCCNVTLLIRLPSLFQCKGNY